MTNKPGRRSRWWLAACCGGLAWSLAPAEPAPCTRPADYVKPAAPISRAGWAAARLPAAEKPPVADWASLDPAARRRWVRRTTFAMTGLPPLWDDVDGAARQDEPATPERLVRRLQATPRYGERWAAWWLKLVGYGDTVEAGGRVRSLPEAWRFRDWTVRRFNDGLRLDRFLTMQWVGGPDRNDAVATTPLVFGAPPADAVPDEAAEEIAGTLSSRWGRILWGVDVSCARCHAHPEVRLTRDDYRGLLWPIFKSHSWDKSGDGWTPRRQITATDDVLAERRAGLAKVAAIEKKMGEVGRAAAREAVDNYLPQTAEYVRLAWQWRREVEGGATEPQFAAFCEKYGLEARKLTQWIAFLGLGTPARPTASPKASESPVTPEPGWWARWCEAVAETDAAAVTKTADQIQKAPPTGEESPFYDPSPEAVAWFTRDQQTQLQRLAQEADVLRQNLPDDRPVHAIDAGGLDGSRYAGSVADAAAGMTPEFFGHTQPLGSSGDSGRAALMEWTFGPLQPVSARALVNHLWAAHFGQPLVPWREFFAPSEPAGAKRLSALAATLVEEKWAFAAIERAIIRSPEWAALETPAPLPREGWREAVMAVCGTLDPRPFGRPASEGNHRRALYQPQPLLPLSPENREAFLNESAAALARRAGEVSADGFDQIGWLHRHVFSREPTDEERTAAQFILAQKSLVDYCRTLLISPAFY